MSYRKKTRDEHFASDGQPKRILALDGGGLRGIFTVALLEKIEGILKERNGNKEEFRLCHYFDLIAGTSTGAIISAALALGMKVSEIKAKYEELGTKVFASGLFSGRGLMRPKYEDAKLIAELKKVYGEDTTVGSEKLQTGLLVVTKRLDTGSVWPVGNNPRGKYFADRVPKTIGNGRYPLWQLVRASTAAPTYFASQKITIAQAAGIDDTDGNFIDGGISPFNNPSLKALMYATLDGFRVGWPTGADRLLLVSLGTGMIDPSVKDASSVEALNGIGALSNLMEDTAVQQEMILQWISTSPTARSFDSEIGDMTNDLLAPAPLLTYLRYNLQFTEKDMKPLDASLADAKLLKDLGEMDIPRNMPTLYRLGEAVAKRDIQKEHFPSRFDLPPA